MLARTSIFALVGVLCVGACSSDDESNGQPTTPACPACAKSYSHCSSPNDIDEPPFQVVSQKADGCTAELNGAPVEIRCEPLAVCYVSGTCEDATLEVDGTLATAGMTCG